MNTTPATTFDFWTLLFSGFAFIGLFYSSKLLAGSVGDRRSQVLGLYLLLQSIALLEYVFYWTRLIYTWPALSEVSLLFPLTYGPLLLIYLDRSFGNDRPWKEYKVHFVPFAILLCFKIPFYISVSEMKLFHTHDIPFGRYFQYYPWFMLWHLTAYGVALVMHIRNQSGVGFMRTWAKWLVGFFIAYVVLSMVYYLLVNFNSLTPGADYAISLASCTTIFLVAWYGHGFSAIANGTSLLNSLVSVSQPSNPVSSNEMIIENPKSQGEPSRQISPPTNEEKYSHSGLPRSLAVRLAEDLESLMQREKLYHQNDLRLEMLANKLNTSKNFVSQVINQNFKVNFFEYINLKRIEEAKQLLRSTSKDTLNIIEVAYAVGFNNKGTFNSVFKRVTGVTPSEFRAQSKKLLETRSN